MGTVLTSYNTTTQDTTHTVSYTSTAGKTILAFCVAPALITLDSASVTAGWVKDFTNVNNLEICVLRLPSASNAGGSGSFTVTHNGARVMAALVIEGDYGAPVHGSLNETLSGSRSSFSTGSQTLDATGEEAFAPFGWTTTVDDPTNDITAYDNSFTEVGDSGYSAASSNEDARMWVASRTNVNLSAVTVTATLSATTSSAPSAVGSGIVAYPVSSGSAASGAGSLTLSASGTAQVVSGGTGGITLSASGAVSAPAAGAGSIVLTASGTAGQPATGTGSLTLTASATAAGASSGTGSLTFTATGTAQVAGAGSGALSLAATGTAGGTAPVTGAASLDLAASGTAVGSSVAVTATASITFGATGEAGAFVTLTTPRGSSAGWYKALAVLQEAGSLQREVGPEAACPNDGEPLQTAPDGGLFCPFDGWRP